MNQVQPNKGMKAFTLRVSVLEHCQLRCAYCLPKALSMLAKKDWLSLSHYEQIARVLARFSFRKIRFTGGEPLLREELPQIVAIFAQAIPSAPLALTTNGQRFCAMAEALKDAGLNTITIHIDSLKAERYQRLMGKGELAEALRAVEKAKTLGLRPKVNVVVQRGLNDDELSSFLEFSKETGVMVRFIELMDTGSARDFVAAHFISGRNILAKLAHLGIVPKPRAHPSDPARLFLAEQQDVLFGLIASDTEPFCSHCDRLRLSANGKIYTCLYEPLGEALNLEADDDALFREINLKINRKESLHPSANKSRRLFSMSQTGG